MLKNIIPLLLFVLFLSINTTEIYSIIHPIPTEELEEYEKYFEENCVDVEPYQTNDMNRFFDDLDKVLKSKNEDTISIFLFCANSINYDFGIIDIASTIYWYLISEDNSGIDFYPYYSFIRDDVENGDEILESLVELFSKYYPKANQINVVDMKNKYYFALARYKKMENEYEESLALLNKAINNGYDQSDVFLERGKVYDNLGDFAGAIKDYDRVLAIDSHNTVVLNYRGVCKLELKDYDGADIDFKKVIELDSNFAHGYNNTALVKWRKAEYDEAIDGFLETLHRFPNYQIALSNLGILRREIGVLRNDNSLVEQSIEDLSTLIAKNKYEAVNYVERAASYFILNEYNKALDDIDMASNLRIPNKDLHIRILFSKGKILKTIQRDNEANEVLYELYNLKPMIPEVYLLLFAHIDLMNKPLDKRTVLEIGAEKCPNCLSILYLNSLLNSSIDVNKSLYYSDLAIELINSSKMDTNQLCIDVATDKIYWQRSHIYSILKRYEDALIPIERAHELAPNNIDYLISFIRLLFMTKKIIETLEHAEKFIKLQPKNPIGYFFRANANYALKNWDKSLEDYRYVISHSKHSLERQFSFLYTASIYYNKKEFKKSMEMLNQGIKEQPFNLLYLDRAKLFLEFKYFDAAKKNLIEALKLDDVSEYNYLVLGLLYNELNQYDKAVKAFNKYLNKYNNDSKVYYERGKANINRGSINEAAADFHKALYYYLLKIL